MEYAVLQLRQVIFPCGDSLVTEVHLNPPVFQSGGTDDASKRPKAFVPSLHRDAGAHELRMFTNGSCRGSSAIVDSRYRVIYIKRLFMCRSLRENSRFDAGRTPPNVLFVAHPTEELYDVITMESIARKS